MLGRLATVVAVLAFGLVPADALASPQDVASTHAYLTASYKALHTTVTTWSSVEASIHKFNKKLAAECPNAAAGSPQNEDEQKLSYEMAGALWSTGYHTDAAIVHGFVHAVKTLKWSNGAITRQARNYTKGLTELAALPLPNVCDDVRAWTATGFKTIPASTLQYDKRVEAIEAKEIAPHLLVRYEQSGDKALAALDIRLNTKFQNLETVNGFNDWDMLLETVGLNQ